MEKIRKIFIDCGAWTGDSIRVFKEYNNNYEIYAFECEPRLKETLQKMSKEMNFNFINKAAWVKKGIIKLYLGQNNLTQSSSLLSSKKKYINKSDPVKINAIDFSQWVISNFKKEDYLICKMNIEGAEYDILEKMIRDGSIDYINRLFISWHWRKLKGFSEKRHKKIETEIKKRTTLLQWKYVEGDNGDPYQ